MLVSEIDDAYRLMEQGQIDAVVFDAPVLRYHAVHEGAGEVATIGPLFEKLQYGLAIAETEADLRERVDLALLEMIESGVYGQLHDRWFGALG